MMPHTIYPEFWTNCWPKTYYCYDLKRICSLYGEIIAKTFDNPNRSAENLKKQMIENPEMYLDCDVDEADFEVKVEEYACHEYCITKDMQYRTRLSWICCILEIWEQNLSRHIVRDLCNSKFPLTEFQKNKIFNGFHAFEKIFSKGMFKESEPKCILDDFPRKGELKELSVLVNSIKHGRGQSLDSLYEDYPKYKMDSLAMYTGTTICTQTLNITDDDFYRFCDVLIDFWQWIPAHIVITNITAFQEYLSRERTKKGEHI